MDNINSSGKVMKVLTSMGYRSEAIECGVRFGIGDTGNAFPVVIFIGDKEMIITCEIARLGEVYSQVSADMKEEFLLGLLDINTQILPYSVALNSDIDGEEEDRDLWPVVLIDSMPMGDISEDELRSSIQSLMKALHTTKDLFSVVFA